MLNYTSEANYIEQKYKRNMLQFQRFEWVTVHVRKSVNWIKWTSPPWLGLGGDKLTHLGARPTQSELVFPHIRALLQTEILLSLICCPGGWSQTITQVKKLDVEVLGWRGYMWSLVVRPVGHTAKFDKIMLETAYGREMNIQLSGSSSCGQSCSQMLIA